MLERNLVIVMGAAQGMGEVHARFIAAKGGRVVLTDVDSAAGEAGALDLRQAGYQADVVTLDVSREEDWRRLIAAVIERHGKVNTLVNNAGIVIHAPIEELTVEQFDCLREVNVRGAFLGCKMVVPAMRAAGGGSTTNISLMSGTIANMPGMTGYCSTKGAVRLLTKAGAVDLVKKTSGSIPSIRALSRRQCHKAITMIRRCGK
jgi:NAD(P)-dependent dehydrogenase (short-subunit alcohol dehydrogenase family)